MRMATDEYWEKERGHKLNPVYGRLARLPMEEEALLAMGPMLTNTDAIELFVLGLEADARRLLDDYVPRLESFCLEAREKQETPRTPQPFSRLLANLSLGIWLQRGEFDRGIAQWAFDAALKRDTEAGGLREGPDLTSLMLLALECEANDEAI